MKEKLKSPYFILAIGILLIVIGIFQGNSIKVKERKQEVQEEITTIDVSEFQGDLNSNASTSASEQLENSKSDKQSLPKGKVIVKYVDTEGKEIADRDESTDYVGEEYYIKRKEITGYSSYGIDPTNKKGNYTTEDTIVTFVYQSSTNTVKVNNESKKVTVSVLNKKKTSEYDFKIVTKSTNGKVLTGAGYNVKDQNGVVIKDSIGYGDSFIVGALTIDAEGTETYTIKQTKFPDRYRAVIDEDIEIKLTKRLDEETGLYIVVLENDTIDGVAAYITENNEIIVEIENEEKEYGNVIINYVDTEGNKIAETEVTEGEVGTEYKYNNTGKEIEGYTFKKVAGNVTGIYTKEDIVITYIYEKKDSSKPVAEYGNVIMMYVDAQGNKIADTETKTGEIGTEYDVSKNIKEIEGYTFKKASDNLAGKFTKEDITVTYLYEKNVEEVFDLELEKSIKEVIIKDNKSEVKKQLKDKNKIMKIEIPSKRVKQTTIQVEYEIVVTNVGEVEGYAKKITDYVPKNFEYVDNGKVNWKVNDRKMTTTDLENKLLKPGESAKLSATFKWELGETDLGERKNSAQISLYYNEKGLEDKTPDNQDDATMIVSIKTGAVSYTFELMGLMLILIGAYIVLKKIRDNK